MAGVEVILLLGEVWRAGAGAGGRLMKRGQVVIVVLGESSRIAAVEVGLSMLRVHRQVI